MWNSYKWEGSLQRLRCNFETRDTVIVVDENFPRNFVAPRSNGGEILRFCHVLKPSRLSTTFWDYAQKLNSYFARVSFDS